MTGDLLTDVEVRVLGTMMEKEATTPEYYPLTLNALVNGCNQKSNRNPAVSYDAETAERALEGLRYKNLALFVTGNGRVDKYAARISETLNLGRREAAVLCTLLLRGPQTLGEIKDRSERMFEFSDLAEVETVLAKFEEWESGPLVKKLARQAGQKEVRYTHLLAGEPAPHLSGSSVAAMTPPTRIAQLEQEVERLRADFDELKTRFEVLEAQLR